MATLQRIRNRAGILVAVIIGLALVAFILGDMLRTGSSLLRPAQTEIGDIDGNSVQYADFQADVEETGDIYKFNSGASQIDNDTWVQIRDQVWENLVQETLMDNVSKNLGLAVTSDELFDMVQGTNIHPIVQQLFINQTTGLFDKSLVLQFLRSLDNGATESQKAYWLYIEDQITKDQLLTKYDNLVSQGLYVTTKEAESSLAAKNKKVNIQFVGLNYTTVPDSTISITDKELRDYYNAHIDDYQQSYTRTIEYVTFPVIATEADEESTLSWMEDVKDEFAQTEDDEQYVNVNSDVSFDDSYYKKDELPEEIGDFAFSGKIGDIYGPYKDGDAYSIVKIDDIQNMPDSVRASHILLTSADALTVADSLKTVIESGEASFEDMARQYSQDTPSAINGGDVGWFTRNQMVKEFEDASFNGEVGKLYITTSSYGVHLIKVTQRGTEVKQVRLATLTRNIEPSTQTFQNVYAQASKFASENTTGEEFQNAIADQNLDKKVVDLNEDDREIAGLDEPRNLVRAAFDTDLNRIIENSEGSTIFELGDNFVIAMLTAINEAGTAPYEDVKVSVELAAKKVKKAEALAAKLNEAATTTNDMDSIAANLNTQVKDANNVYFTLSSVTGAGIEPALIGTVCSMDQDQLSEPIKGNNGVYLAKVISINNDESNSDIPVEKQTLEATLSSRAYSDAYEVQKNAADIEDKRAKFY